MPTERFYRLPEAKKQTIREAAIKEFARVPFEKASINQIIQNADISRGSFYTYFEDKQDVVQYIFEDNANQLRDCCENEIKKNGGDFFALLVWLFDFTIRKLNESQEMIEVVKHVFSYQENAKAFGLGIDGREPIPGMCQAGPPVDWFRERIRMEQFTKKTEHELEALLQLGITSLLLAIRFYYQKPEDLERIRERYLDSLEILKHGVLMA